MHITALAVRQSAAPLHRNPDSKSSLCAYPHVLPCLRCINESNIALQ